MDKKIDEKLEKLIGKKVPKAEKPKSEYSEIEKVAVIFSESESKSKNAIIKSLIKSFTTIIVTALIVGLLVWLFSTQEIEFGRRTVENAVQGGNAAIVTDSDNANVSQ